MTNIGKKLIVTLKTLEITRRVL